MEIADGTAPRKLRSPISGAARAGDPNGRTASWTEHRGARCGQANGCEVRTELQRGVAGGSVTCGWASIASAKSVLRIAPDARTGHMDGSLMAPTTQWPS